MSSRAHRLSVVFSLIITFSRWYFHNTQLVRLLLNLAIPRCHKLRAVSLTLLNSTANTPKQIQKWQHFPSTISSTCYFFMIFKIRNQVRSHIITKTSTVAEVYRPWRLASWQLPFRLPLPSIARMKEFDLWCPCSLSVNTSTQKSFVDCDITQLYVVKLELLQ